jgi:hypothetical protein
MTDFYNYCNSTLRRARRPLLGNLSGCCKVPGGCKCWGRYER